MEQEDKELYQEILVEKEDVGQNLMDDPFNPAAIDIDTKSPRSNRSVTRKK